MKVLNARVNEMLGYANPPHLELLVDTLDGEFVYRTIEIDRGTAYFAEADGHVRFMFHNPANENGYAGAVFHVTLEDGSTRDVKGPWSSNPGDMEKLFGIPSIDVSMTADPEAFERGYTFFAGHVTLELAQSAMKFVPGWNLEVGYHGLTKENPA